MTTLMTAAQFKTKTNRFWSKWDGAVVEIENQLKRYHDVNNFNLQDDIINDVKQAIVTFQQEKFRKYFGTGKTSCRKDGVDELLTQVTAKIKERDDLAFYRLQKSTNQWRSNNANEELIQKLLDCKVRKTKPNDDCKRKVKECYDAIDTFFNELGGEGWDAATKKYPIWKNYSSNKFAFSAANGGLKDHEKKNYLGDNPKKKFQAAGTVRICSIDVNSLVGGMQTAKYLKFNPDIIGSDVGAKQLEQVGIGRGLEIQAPPAELMGDEIRAKIEDYLKSFLGCLPNETALAQQAAALEKNDLGDQFRAVVTLDYFALRPQDFGMKLHKDTVGSSLIVALQYLNDTEMEGPEYVDDPAPMRVKPSWDKNYVCDTYDDEEYLKGDFTRGAAPWMKSCDGYVWPADLLEALQGARRESPKPQNCVVKRAGAMPPGGIVSFVDELIYHATPLDRHRNDGDKRLVNAGVVIADSNSGNYQSIYGTRRVKRRYSIDMEDSNVTIAPSSANSGVSENVRRFLRLWISIVPKEWYDEYEFSGEKITG